MSVATNVHKTSDTAHNRPSCALGLSLESDMSETKNDERGAFGAVKRRRTTTIMLTVDEVRKCRELAKPPMTDPIDYSRPVGWWCPVCGMEWREYPQTRISRHAHAVIPRYLPIPEGQRPPAASDVEEAEVVTWDAAIFSWHSRPNRKRKRWVISVETDAERHINYIVTGATE